MTIIGTRLSGVSRMRRADTAPAASAATSDPSILLLLLARDAQVRVGQGFQALPLDRMTAFHAMAEAIRVGVQAAERIVDRVEATALLGGEEKRLLTFHGVG